MGESHRHLRDQADSATLGDKAKDAAHQASEKFGHFIHGLHQKAEQVAHSPQVDMAGQATKEALNKLKHAAGVEKLDLSHNPLLTNKDLSPLVGIQTLTHLNLGFNPKLTDEGIASVLRGDHNLKHLNVENTLITGASLALLPHTMVASLVLRNVAKLNSHSVGDLSHARSLRNVDFSNNKQITDSWVPELKTLTQVENFDFRATGLSAKAIDELKHALPHANIRH